MDTLRHRVLVVDDEDDTRTALAMLIRSEGYVVDTAPDGQRALESFEQHRPDLVLSDLLMPEMDGLELIRRVRSRGSEVPILLVTAFCDERTRVAAHLAGASGFITKPIDIDKILDAIALHLSSCSTTQAIERTGIAGAEAPGLPASAKGL